MPSIASRARYAARHAAKDTGLTYGEARLQALKRIPDLEGLQRAIYLSIWRKEYNQRVTRRAVLAVLIAANEWIEQQDATNPPQIEQPQNG